MTYSSIEDIILTILAILVIVILLGTIYSIVRAIIQFIFSNWDSEKIKKAWNSIRYTIIGIIVTIFLLFFLPMIFQRISPSSWINYSAKNILNRSMDLWRKILSIGWFYNNPLNTGNPWSIDWGTNEPPIINNPL